MARQPTLTVNVNSQQFQQFARNFNAFSGQIKQLNQQFGQINSAINRTTIGAKALQATLSGVLSVTKSIGSTTWRITKHLVSWGTIIGGVTALLGMGGGLFGIDRLASSILAKRRMVMGLGGDYGRTQASMIGYSSVLGSPGSALQNIRMGLGGSTEQQRALITAGIDPFTTKMTPDEILDKILAEAPAKLAQGGPGNELRMAKSLGYDKIFTDPMDLMRMTSEEGRKEIQEKRKWIKEHEKELTLSKEAQKGWSGLAQQIMLAKANVENIFGEKLFFLTKPLEHLSEGFQHLVKVLMDSPAVQKLMKTLAYWIEKLADKMKHLTEKDIDEFIEKVKTWIPAMEKVENALTLFSSTLDQVVKFLTALLPHGGDPMAGAAQAAGAGVVHDWLKEHLTPAGKDLLGFDKGRTPAATAPSSGTERSPSSLGFATTPNTPSTPGSPASTLDVLRGGVRSSLSPSPPSLPLSLRPSARGAVGRMTPPSGGGGGGLFGGLPSPTGSENRGGPGPLSMGNWQMNRTASLVVRNVPGANIFMSAAGMTA